MIRFYAPEIRNIPVLPEGESAHCVRVLRHREGDEINVVDGKGNLYLCKIIKAHPEHTEITIIKEESISQTGNYSLTLAVAPTKNADRIEWMIEKAVEIGVDRIVLLHCQRSERKIFREDRLVKVMVSAMKQSLSAKLPELEGVISLEEFVKRNDKEAQKFFGYCSPVIERKEFVRECQPGGKVIVMIGPEGDFTEEEVTLSIENGFMPVTFGEKRLRTETAGVYGMTLVPWCRSW